MVDMCRSKPFLLTQQRPEGATAVGTWDTSKIAHTARGGKSSLVVVAAAAVLVVAVVAGTRNWPLE